MSVIRFNLASLNIRFVHLVEWASACVRLFLSSETIIKAYLVYAKLLRGYDGTKFMMFFTAVSLGCQFAMSYVRYCDLINRFYDKLIKGQWGK